MRVKALPRGYIIIFLKVLSLRWKGEQHVISLRLMSRNALNQKQSRLPSSPGHSQAVPCPKKQIRLKGADVPSCLCVILRRVIITICRRIKVTTFLSEPMPPRTPPSADPSSPSVSPWYSPVTGSMSPGSASQILARKKRRGVSGLQPLI